MGIWRQAFSPLSIGALIRKHYTRPLDLGPSDRRARLYARLVCVLFLVVALGWLIQISRADDLAALNSMGPWVIFAGILGILCILGTIFVCFNALRSWQTSGRWIWTKLSDVALALACLSLVWFLFLWKLMNFNTRY